MSPSLFNIALDKCLMRNTFTRSLIEARRLFAYADDLAIKVDYDDTTCVQKVFDVLATEGFEVNPSKCFYIGPGNIPDINQNGKYKECEKYLGTYLCTDKTVTKKKVKLSLLTNAGKIKTVLGCSPHHLKRQITNSLYNSLALYHLAPGLLSGEINTKDINQIHSSCTREIESVPGMVAIDLLLAIMPRQNLANWIGITTANQVEKIKRTRLLEDEFDNWKYETGLTPTTN